MNILFVGKFYPRSILASIASDTNGKVGFSNHNFEISLIKGFSKVENVDLKVITAPMVFSFPHNNRRPFIRTEEYTDNGISISSIGFCNISVINQFSKVLNLRHKILLTINSFKPGPVYIVVNTPNLVLSKAVFSAIKKSHRNVKTTLIVPDIPECLVEMGHTKSLKRKLVERLNRVNARYSLRYDKYVFLTEAMNDFFHVDKSRFIVMEGLIDDARVLPVKNLRQADNKEIILYTGTLTRLFGVMDLVNMFDRANFPNCELWICGSGECATEIEDKAKANPNIKFYGLVDSSVALRLQSQATILANPRSAKGNYTKYSFPSKTIEYLLAGKTVIMNRLPGIPAEYDKYLHYPANESIEAWIEKIHEIMSLEPKIRNSIDSNGRAFICSNKIASVQCKQIADFMRL